MDWAALALAGLKLVLWFLGNEKDQQNRQAGVDEEIARSATAILAKTAAAKRILGEVNGLTPAQVDDMLRQLEPGGALGLRADPPAKNPTGTAGR